MYVKVICIHATTLVLEAGQNCLLCQMVGPCKDAII